MTVEFDAPLQLYERWENGHWTAHAIDPGRDEAGWQALKGFTRQAMADGLEQFARGERAVTSTLGPIVAAAPTFESQVFLCTQLADEARHSVFFDRYLAAIPGSSSDRRAADGPRAPDSFAPLFEEELEELSRQLCENPDDRATWHRAIVVYHIVVEGVLASTGHASLVAGARSAGKLPALTEGLEFVGRDEARHIAFGVWASRAGIRDGFEDVISEQLCASVGPAVRALVRPERRTVGAIPLGALASWGRKLERDWLTAFEMLDSRLRVMRLPPNAQREIAQAWYAGRETALDEYEGLHGRPHPARRPAAVSVS